MIVARGNFSTSLYAALSRTQIEFGGPSTFGLEIARADEAYDPSKKTGSSFELGSMIDRGSFNYRWPLNEYYLDLHKDLRKPANVQGTGASQNNNPGTGSASNTDGNCSAVADVQGHVGTCQMLSFAMGDMFYQILRIEEGGHLSHNDRADGDAKLCRRFPDDSRVVLNMGGPVWFRSFRHSGGFDDNAVTKDQVSSPSSSSMLQYC
jgi:hypothetical protein